MERPARIIEISIKCVSARFNEWLTKNLKKSQETKLIKT